MECKKVWGPTKQNSNSSNSSNASGATTPLEANEETTLILPPSPAFITDCNLSDREVFLLRRIQFRVGNSKFSSCVGTLLKNLWNSYGNIFENETLRYGALMFESYWFDSDKPTWSPKGSVEYFLFKSRFNDTLWDAMEKRDLNEAHLLALFLATQSSKSGVAIFKNDLAVYQQGMVHVLRFLDQSRKRGFRPLHDQETFFLSFTRRVMCRGDFSMPEYLVRDHAIDILPHQSDQATHQIVTRHPISKGLPEMRFPSHPPPRPSPQYQRHPDNLHTWDYWNETVCCLCHEFEEMSVIFQMLVGQRSRSVGSHQYLEDAVIRIRKKVDTMVNVNDISYVFKTVYPVVTCLTK